MRMLAESYDSDDRYFLALFYREVHVVVILTQYIKRDSSFTDRRQTH